MSCDNCPYRFRPTPRPASVYAIRCENCGAQFDSHEPVCACPKCGVQIVVFGWGGKK